MTAHARRVLDSVADALSNYDAATAFVTDLQASVGGAAAALDNQHREIVLALERTANELEVEIFATPREQEREQVSEITLGLRRLIQEQSDGA